MRETPLFRAQFRCKALDVEAVQLRESVVEWVTGYCRQLRRANSSAGGDAVVRALWFSRSRRRAVAVVHERVDGFATAYITSRIEWELGDSAALAKSRVP